MVISDFFDRYKEKIGKIHSRKSNGAFKMHVVVQSNYRYNFGESFESCVDALKLFLDFGESRIDFLGSSRSTGGVAQSSQLCC